MTFIRSVVVGGRGLVEKGGGTTAPLQQQLLMDSRSPSYFEAGDASLSHIAVTSAQRTDLQYGLEVAYSKSSSF